MAAHTTAPLLPEGATALEIPSDRPAYYNSFKASGVPAAATAVHLVTPPSERRTSRPQRVSVYMPAPPPDDREAAMRGQPFELEGATMRVVREGDRETSIFVGGGRRFRVEYNYMAHVALHDYPVEQRTAKDIEGNCTQFGFLHEVDPACYGAPDLATVHVVLQLEHPREIPHQVRIGYFDGTKNVVPVEIVRIWDRAHSYDADGQYVRLFQEAPAAAA